MLQTLPLFSQVVSHDDIKITDAQQKIIAKVCDSQDFGKIQSSKDMRVLEDDRLAFLKKKIDKKFREFTDEVLVYDTEFAMTTSWFSRIKPRAPSPVHNHKNSMFSGVFYFGNDEAQTSIDFYPFNVLSSYSVEPRSINIYNATFYSHRAKNNSVVFFPSTLCHQARRCHKLRHSLAFNFIPIGEYGHADSASVPSVR